MPSSRTAAAQQWFALIALPAIAAAAPTSPAASRGQLLARLQKHAGAVKGLEFNSFRCIGATAAVGCCCTAAVQWTIWGECLPCAGCMAQHVQPCPSPPTASVLSYLLPCSPNLLASGGADGELCIWDVGNPLQPSLYPAMQGGAGACCHALCMLWLLAGVAARLICSSRMRPPLVQHSIACNDALLHYRGRCFCLPRFAAGPNQRSRTWPGTCCFVCSCCCG